MSRAAQVFALLRADEDALAAIDTEAWAALSRLADEHRIAPMLHELWHTNDAVPPAVREGWAAAYRKAALDGLMQERVLLQLADHLARAGHRPVVLKGGWLARHVYAAPALRPLRDIDLLVPPDELVAAYRAARSFGCAALEMTELPLDEWARRYKHLPALGFDGVVVELHGRLWDAAAGAPALPRDVFACAVPDKRHQDLQALSARHLVRHLAVHAVWIHRWDNGPLGIVDLVELCAARPHLAWDGIWHDARTEGWDRILALWIAAADRWLAPGLSERTGGRVLAVPDGLVEAAGEAMVAPVAMREADRSARRFAKRHRFAAMHLRLRRAGSPGEAARWALDQARGWLAVRRDAGSAARYAANRALEEWLAG